MWEGKGEGEERGRGWRGMGVGEACDGNSEHGGRLRELILEYLNSHTPALSLAPIPPLSFMSRSSLLFLRDDCIDASACPEPLPCSCSPDQDCVIINRSVVSLSPSTLLTPPPGAAMSAARPPVSQSRARTSLTTE